MTTLKLDQGQDKKLFNNPNAVMIDFVKGHKFNRATFISERGIEEFNVWFPLRGRPLEGVWLKLQLPRLMVSVHRRLLVLFPSQILARMKQALLRQVKWLLIKLVRWMKIVVYILQEDLFFGCGKGFLSVYLAEYIQDPEEVIHRISKGVISDDLLFLAIFLEQIPP